MRFWCQLGGVLGCLGGVLDRLGTDLSSFAAVMARKAEVDRSASRPAARFWGGPGSVECKAAEAQYGFFI